MRTSIVAGVAAVCMLIVWGMACSVGACPTCRRDDSPPGPTRDCVVTECGVECGLSPDQRALRRDRFDQAIRPRIQEVRELSDGYALRFDPDDALIINVTSWIRDERKCCGFLEYRLVVERDDGPIWLQAIGDPNAKQFVANALGLPQPGETRP
jgi:hypothetical protein